MGAQRPPRRPRATSGPISRRSSAPPTRGSSASPPASCGSRDEAEDVAQEVFLAFGRSSVPAGEAMGWLTVAAAHTALNHLRSGRRRASREQAAGRGDAVAPDVADAIVTRDDRRRVREALARLPRRQAVALVLRHSGLSYAEVAAALDLSPGSVGTTVRRAESALREELNRHASSD